MRAAAGLRHTAPAAETVGCSRCSARYATPGELIAHLAYVHVMGDEQARLEAMQAAESCPGCGRRSGNHNKTCRVRGTWKPPAALAPASPRPLWSYAMPVLLPLRVAMRAFRRSYLAHAVAECGGDAIKLAPVLGIERNTVHQALKAAGLPRLGDKATYTCGRCGRGGHNAATCRRRRRKS